MYENFEEICDLSLNNNTLHTQSSSYVCTVHVHVQYDVLHLLEIYTEGGGRGN